MVIFCWDYGKAWLGMEHHQGPRLSHQGEGEGDWPGGVSSGLPKNPRHSPLPP